MIEEREFNEIIQLITRTTGIIPRESHSDGIKRYVDERIKSFDSVADYLAFFSQNKDEMIALINKATVNETYFFREEKQMDLLKTKIFPKLSKKNPVVRIWSAACSSGEEIYSLALLADSCNVKTELFASDINTLMLEKCQRAVYGSNSVREMDGNKYLNLLDSYKTADGKIEMSKELAGRVKSRQVNLSNIEANPFLEKQNIIFIRNVFIYFSQETKARILKILAQKCLCDDGYIFVSMNEIASIDSSIVPLELERIMDGNVFYFHKRT